MIKQKQANRIELEQTFRKFSRGDSIPLAALAQLLNVDCGSPARHSESPGYGIARRAAKFIESETNGHLVIRWDREQTCWRALLKEEIPSESALAIKQIRKRSKANAKICQAAIVDGVEGADRDRCVANLTLSNALYQFSSRTVINRTLGMIATGGVNTMTEEAALEILRRRS